MFTLLGEPAELEDDVRALVRGAVDHLDLRIHQGVHPRFGVVDVLPFVPLGSTAMTLAVELRERVSAWMAAELAMPTFRYGPLPDGSLRSLPEVRRDAFNILSPDAGPQVPHTTAGATAVGARDVLVAWNIWLDGVDLEATRRIASMVRSSEVRTLGLAVRNATQVSCNLVAPDRSTPAEVLDAVMRALAGTGTVRRCELVGLAPTSMLKVVPTSRWDELDLAPERTIEAAAQGRGLTIR